MILTNKHGAPKTIVRAVEMDPYTKGDAEFSVTELISPPQLNRLYHEHYDKLSVDVADEAWKLLGRGVHHVLSEANKDLGLMQEHRLFATVDGTTVASGQYDLYENGKITDYKVTSVFAIKDGVKDEWVKQLNLYAWLCRENELRITEMQIVVVLRDWVKSRAGKGDFPVSPFKVLPVPLWSYQQQKEYVQQRISLHQMETPPRCTMEDRWARGAWAVKKEKVKKVKSFIRLEDATQYAQENGGNVVSQKPTYPRCESWCPVADFCPQWQEEKQK